MSYKIMQKLSDYLSEEFVLIKSPFVETTREGKHLYSVIIALTPRTLMIIPSHDERYRLMQDDKPLQFDSFHPLESTKLEVFKKSRRQSIKVRFETDATKYFELGKSKKRKIFWKLWCIHVSELNKEHRKWPFIHFQCDYQCKEERSKKKNHLPWTDKYLYLGSKRATEDEHRPKPVPGLGPPEDIKLLYLKPKYFGCWDQSEHWVQCGNSTSSFYD